MASHGGKGTRITFERLDQVIYALESKKPGAVSGSYAVSFSAPYAIHVHENLEMKLRGQPRPSGRGAYWDARGRKQGQSKFLEAPARAMRQGAGLNLVNWMRKGMIFVQATRKLAFTLLAAARALVPYEFGDLYKSGKVDRLY